MHTQHGFGDNFLNFLMKDDRMITISTPDTVEVKNVNQLTNLMPPRPRTCALRDLQTHTPLLST